MFSLLDTSLPQKGPSRFVPNWNTHIYTLSMKGKLINLETRQRKLMTSWKVDDVIKVTQYARIYDWPQILLNLPLHQRDSRGLLINLNNSNGVILFCVCVCVCLYAVCANLINVMILYLSEISSSRVYKSILITFLKYMPMKVTFAKGAQIIWYLCVNWSSTIFF